jgi:glycosyltransferase involved in cell wall biosynthesis
MTRWLLISGDFTPLGGMDRANHALAAHLAGSGRQVHLVTHRAWPDLERHPNITVHGVPRPLGSHLFGAPLLAAAGERWSRKVRDVRVVANGGNADTRDAAWIHYVHAAYTPFVAGGAIARGRASLAHRYYLARERRALANARVVICNSRRTAADAIERVGVDPARVRTVYYGADARQLSAVSPDDRAAARRALGWSADRLVALFVGALGDRRKGFDRLFDAWSRLAGGAAWDVDLVVAGEGGELEAWRQRARGAGLERRVEFLGFRRDVPALIAASDLLVHPARYEAYGLGVHEALCRGIPALVSASAGVAERYPANLSDLLLQDPESVDELCDRLLRCRAQIDRLTRELGPFADALRGRSWDDMADEIVRAVA